MAAEEGGSPSKSKKTVRRKSGSKASDTPQKSKIKASPSKKATSNADAGIDEEENPGLLLGDIVDGMSFPLGGSSASTSGAARKKQKVASKAKKKRKAEPEDELAGLGLDDAFGSGDFAAEDGDDELPDASDKLLGTLQKLSAEDDADGGFAAKRAQAQPESEFHVGAGDEVTIEDLLKPLEEGNSFGDVRKQLEGLAKREAMPEPVSEVKRTREERSAQYEASSKDIRKWFPQVHRMNRADQVVLGAEPETVKGTAAIVSTFEASDDFEKELAEVTKAAGTTEEEVRGAKALPMNSRIREEQQTRQVARLKALMLREQQSSKRVKKIKSKTYRRIHRKAETRDREVLLERLEHENPELAKQLRQEFEKKHAEKRLLRNRNARKKWAQTMQRFAKGDRNAQQEITKQAQKHHDDEKALRRAVRGQDVDQSEESDAVDLSGSDDEGSAKHTLGKAQKLTMHEIRNMDVEGSDLPTKGLLGMKFMQQAIKSKRENAQKEALDVLKELEGMEKKLDDYHDSDKEDDEEAAAARLAKLEAAKAKKGVFTQEELAKAEKEVEKMLDEDDNVTACTVAGALTVHGVSAANLKTNSKKSLKKGRAKGIVEPVAANTSESTASASASSSSRPAAEKTKAAEPVVENPWETSWNEAVEADGADEKAQKDQPESSLKQQASAQAGKKLSKAERKRKNKEARESKEAEEEALDEGGNEDLLGALSHDTAQAREQRELVRTAFVEGTQMEDFEAEIDDEDRALEEKSKDKRGLADLPGWGSWAGEGAPKPRQSPAAKAKAAKEEAAAKARAAARKRGAAVFLDAPTENAKYFIDKVPFGFQNPDQYEQQLKMPSGPEWNALPTHLQRIKPKFFSKVGTIVPPLQLVKHLPKESQAGVIETWARSKQPKRLKAKI